MKSVRFSKVVEKSGRPEVYLLMSETDPDFHKAVEADKIKVTAGPTGGWKPMPQTIASEGIIVKRPGE